MKRSLHQKEVAVIKQLLEFTFISDQQIADLFSCSRAAINHIRNGRRWNDEGPTGPSTPTTLIDILDQMEQPKEEKPECLTDSKKSEQQQLQWAKYQEDINNKVEEIRTKRSNDYRMFGPKPQSNEVVIRIKLEQ